MLKKKYQDIINKEQFYIKDLIFQNKSIKLNKNWNEQVIYYYSPQVTFREIPNEVSLTIPTLCYEHCSEDCNSKFCWIENWKEEKNRLTFETLLKLVENNKEVSCVTIMTSLNFLGLNFLIYNLKLEYPNIKIALYIGKDWEELLNYKDFHYLNFDYIDYIKIGSYKKELGTLEDNSTNQRFYQINHTITGNEFINQNYLFTRNI